MKLLGVSALVGCVLAGFTEEEKTKYSIEVLAEGTEGTEPTKGSLIGVHYDGTLTTGAKFDSSYDRGDPLRFHVGNGQVIKCWDEVCLKLNIGAKVKVLCPSETAYGSAAVGPLPANSDLQFIMERM